MPKKVVLDQASFEAFARRMYARGFRKVGGSEIRSDFHRLGIVVPRPRKGRETGFRFDAHGLTVIAWPSYLEEEGEAREEDLGWVLIKEGDEPRYYAQPVKRTGNFFKKLLLRAAIARERVLNRPRCPKCGAYMRIAQGKGIKSRYWECWQNDRHEDEQPEFQPWDIGLKPIVLEYVLKMRKQRARDRKRGLEKALAEGRDPPVPAVLKRKSSQITKPENKV